MQSRGHERMRGTSVNNPRNHAPITLTYESGAKSQNEQLCNRVGSMCEFAERNNLNSTSIQRAVSRCVYNKEISKNNTMKFNSVNIEQLYETDPICLLYERH